MPYLQRNEFANAVRGNQKIGHAALEVSLVFHGFELAAAIAEKKPSCQ